MKMPNFINKKFLLISIIFIIQLYNYNSYLIGIDLGSEFFKATMLRPQRPFTMVENIQSKTKTPTAVAFKDDERVFGAEAIAKKPRVPKQVLVYFHEFLIKKYNQDEVKRFIDNFFVSYELEEDTERGTINVKIEFNKEEFKFSSEEIFGMLFRYIKYLADKFSNADIKDCVVTVPAFFGYKERQALSQAVEMSKLNLLGLITENVAASIHFAQTRQFNSTEHYIFYNMGSLYTQATLVSFVSNYQVKNNKTVETSKVLNVVGETWERELGGTKLSYNLIRHLMDKFDEMPQRQGKPSVKNDYRVAERMFPSATKYKEILSANKATPVTILGVEAGMNLETKLTREEFEEANKEDLEKAFLPIERLLNQTGLDLTNITQIELIGGSIRVPKVQEILKTKLGEFNNLVGTHMNGDDSMALGAAYHCANFSSNFKGGKIELYHGPNYEVKLKLDHLINDVNAELPLCEDFVQNVTSLSENCVRKLDKSTTLYKIRKGLDLARTVTLKHDGDIQVKLYQKFQEDSEDNKSLLMTFNVTGYEKVLTAMKNENLPLTTQPKIHLRFKQDQKGLITLRAEASFEITLYMTLQTGPTGGEEVIYLSNYTEPTSYEEIKAYEEELKGRNLTDTARKTLLNMRRDVGRKKTKEEKIELQVDMEYSSPRPLTKEEIRVSREKLDRLDEMDANRIKTMEKRNQLETLIYAKKDWVQSNEAPLYSKEGEIDLATEGLNIIADWYEEDGYIADFETINKKFDDLVDKFRHFDQRQKTHHKREKSIDKFHTEMNKLSEDALNLIKYKPWLENHYNSTFMKEIDQIHAWMNEFKEKQGLLALHEDPVLHPEVILSKIQNARKEYYTMTRIPKPKAENNTENFKIEDLMKNRTTLEDLIKKANLTMEDFDKMNQTLNEGKNNETTTEESSLEQEVLGDEVQSDKETSESSEEVKNSEL